MKKLLLLVLVTTGIFSLAVAAPQKTPSPRSVPKTAPQPAASSRVTCTVTGASVPLADAENVVYQGKTYYFCCAGCIKQFKKNPAKYIKSAPRHTS